MNLVEALTRRSAGLEQISNYDVPLHRLRCDQNDVYEGISLGIDEDRDLPNRPILAARFCDVPGYKDIVALADEDGKIAIQDTSKEGPASMPVKGYVGHRNAILEIAWMPGEMKLVTSSGDHTTRLWDVLSDPFKSLGCYNGHTRGVRAVTFRPEDKAVFASGSRDGAIMLWDIRASHTGSPKPDNCIWNTHGCVRNVKYRRGVTTNPRAHSITSLVFQDDYTLFSCASGDGFIKAWDIRKNYTVHKKEPVAKHVLNYAGGSTRKGFTSILICPARISLYASCMDNIIYQYNISSYNPDPVAEFYGHRISTFFVKACLSPDGKYLASGSSEEYSYIWNTKRPGYPLLKLWGHSDEVDCVDWCDAQEPKIITSSDDCTHRIWRVGLEHGDDNYKLTSRGYVVDVEKTRSAEQATQETTPTVSRRRSSIDYRTPSSDVTPDTTPDVDANRRGIPDDLNSETRLAKRSYGHMIGRGPWTDGKFKSVLSPITENFEPKAKRAHIESRGARRLFSPVSEREPPSSSSSSLHNGYESDEPGPSSSSSTQTTCSTPFSPTLNLPNYVIDGTAPHLVQVSPQKCKENIDWLTKIRKERYELRIGRVDTEKGTSSNTTPGRRTSRAKSTEPRKESKHPAVSLLNFFRISSKDCTKERLTDNITQSKAAPEH